MGSPVSESNTQVLFRIQEISVGRNGVFEELYLVVFRRREKNVLTARGRLPACLHSEPMAFSEIGSVGLYCSAFSINDTASSCVSDKARKGGKEKDRARIITPTSPDTHQQVCPVGGSRDLCVPMPPSCLAVLPVFRCKSLWPFLVCFLTRKTCKSVLVYMWHT